MIKTQTGIVIPLALVFGAIFVLYLGGLLGFVGLQVKESNLSSDYEQALHIAEAGLDFAAWHLAHWPTDYAFSGQYDYKDPEGAIIGRYVLTVTAPSGCAAGAQVQAQAWTIRTPQIKRTVQASYGQQSLAAYAFLTNTNGWFGPDETLNGPLHSNGGLRMDGNQNSLATSAKETYTCGPEHGCNPATQKPGVWGSGPGGPAGLWQFPAPAVDFEQITQDLANLKSLAQSQGIYLQQLDQGYHLVFKSNGTVDVFRVQNLKQPVWGYDGQGWIRNAVNIDGQTFLANYALPVNCAPIFVEDTVWVDGTISGRATLVAAKLPEQASSMKSIYINGNINQADADSALGLLAQKDVLIPLEVPNDLTVQAALLAQKGQVIRHYYPNWNQEPYKTYAIRNSITTFGTIITNGLWTFSWVDGLGNIVSGYRNTELGYDVALTLNPPPYFPSSGQNERLNWQELSN